MAVVARWSHGHYGDETKRVDFPAPRHIKDDLGVAGVLNHADGKRYDSYSSYKAAVKAAGCEIIGDKKPEAFKPAQSKGSGADIKKAIEQLKSR